MDKPELKPCPFCSGEAILTSRETNYFTMDLWRHSIRAVCGGGDTGLLHCGRRQEEIKWLIHGAAFTAAVRRESISAFAGGCYKKLQLVRRLRAIVLDIKRQAEEEKKIDP